MSNRRSPRDFRAELRDVREEAAALDLRRQKQIVNQTASISRLLENPDAALEIERLHRRLAEVEMQLFDLSSKVFEAATG